MNNELRERIAGLLITHPSGLRAVGDPPDWPWAVADAILALPGIAVVELPEPECVTDNTAGWAGWTWAVNRNVGVVIVDMDSGGGAVSPDQARKLAAALLAAAEHAEREQ